MLSCLGLLNLASAAGCIGYRDLMQSSMFSNLPIVDCHYDITKDLPVFEKVYVKMLHFACSVIFCLRCFWRLVGFWQVQCIFLLFDSLQHLFTFWTQHTTQ